MAFEKLDEKCFILEAWGFAILKIFLCVMAGYLTYSALELPIIWKIYISIWSATFVEWFYGELFKFYLKKILRFASPYWEQIYWVNYQMLK